MAAGDGASGLSLSRSNATRLDAYMILCQQRGVSLLYTFPMCTDGVTAPSPTSCNPRHLYPSNLNQTFRPFTNAVVQQDGFSCKETS